MQSVEKLLPMARIFKVFTSVGWVVVSSEDAQESVVLRELLDKKLWNIPDRIKDKGQFEEKLNQSIRQYNPEYWRARQSGREAENKQAGASLG